MWQHCTARINATHLFIAGNGLDTKMAYIVDVTSNPFQFTRLPPMLKKRNGAACGTIKKSPLHPNEYNVPFIAGGCCGDSTTITTELFLLNEQKWIKGPQLVRGFNAGDFINRDGKTFLIGGIDGHSNLHNDIMMWNHATNEIKIMPGKMTKKKVEVAVMTVEDGDLC